MTQPVWENIETRFAGLPISEGIAVGRVCLVDDSRHFNIVACPVGPGEAKRERKRLDDAIETATAQIDLLVQEVTDRVGAVEGEIFRVQRMILQDTNVQKSMIDILEQDRVNAEAAVTRALDSYESRIRAVRADYLRERGTDISEIRQRLLDVLQKIYPSLKCAGQDSCERGRDRIIVAEELTPRMTAELDARRTRGFVTVHGGPTSHAAILARAFGLPAVSGIDNIHVLLSCGTGVLINGDTGELIIWPSEKTCARYLTSKRATEVKTAVVEPLPGFEVMANISLASEAPEATEMKADGIGMYRTEFEFITANRALTEDEQFERYFSVARAMNGRPVTIRLLDIGGDKAPPFLELPKEKNPSLGLRGARFLLSRPDLLRTQARAIARASRHGRISVLYPMITSREQFLALRALFLDNVGDLPGHNLKHGVMFEVPSACLEARAILEVAEFGSIGTNDLIQYLFAIDRSNELVAGDYEPSGSALWSLIRKVVLAAEERDRHLSVCGEVVGSADLLRRYIGTGIRTVSVSCRLIPEVRRAAGREIDANSNGSGPMPRRDSST